VLEALCVAGARACENLILDTREVAIVMSVGTSGSPGGDYERIPCPRSHTFPTVGEWGNVVVSKDITSIPMYQEFPTGEKFYDDVTASSTRARLLHAAYRSELRLGTAMGRFQRAQCGHRDYLPFDAVWLTGVPVSRQTSTLAGTAGILVARMQRVSRQGAMVAGGR
jgi:hypothetical protein